MTTGKIMKKIILILLALLPFYVQAQSICEVVDNYQKQIENQKDPNEKLALVLEMQGELAQKFGEQMDGISEELANYIPPNDEDVIIDESDLFIPPVSLAETQKKLIAEFEALTFDEIKKLHNISTPRGEHESLLFIAGQFGVTTTRDNSTKTKTENDLIRDILVAMNLVK